MCFHKFTFANRIMAASCTCVYLSASISERLAICMGLSERERSQAGKRLTLTIEPVHHLLEDLSTSRELIDALMWLDFDCILISLISPFHVGFDCKSSGLTLMKE